MIVGVVFVGERNSVGSGVGEFFVRSLVFSSAGVMTIDSRTGMSVDRLRLFGFIFSFFGSKKAIRVWRVGRWSCLSNIPAGENVNPSCTNCGGKVNVSART